MDGYEPATVNWSAHGSQPPEIAKAYGQGLILASKIAEEMNDPVYKYLVEGNIENEHIKAELVGNNPEQIRNSDYIEGLKNVTITKVG